MDSPLSRFLRGRGVSEDCLQWMEQDHIDAGVIDCMDDDNLAGYIPTCGDRIAARRFCLDHGQHHGTKQATKTSLLDKLKQRMGIGDTDDNTNQEKRRRTYAKHNKWAEKPTRKIELGWIHESKQVRKRRGGWGGENKVGKIEAFSHDILDYQEEAIFDDVIIVGELYSILRMGVLRIYLCTKTPEDKDDEECVMGTSNNKDEQLNDMLEEDDQPIQTSDIEANLDTSEVIAASSTSDTALREDEASITPPPTANDTAESESVDEVARSSTPSLDVVLITIRLHRVNLLEEMIGQFKDAALLKHKLRYTYIDESGADADGISRDVYAAFWTELLDHTAEGEDQRIQSLCPKWQEEEWKSIERILLKGFQDHGYFPCCLSPAFTVALIFGEQEVSDGVLFDRLLLYVSHSDRSLITTALNGELSEEEKDELIDLLDRLDVTAVPTQKNLKGILLKVAHKQLIQKPRYASEKMSFVAGSSLREALASPQDVLHMYEAKKPTTKRLLKMLHASPSSQAETQSFRFLQQYIRGLDEAGLRRVLRFVTGSDVICASKITIMFTAVEGLARRPVAHTCGPVLELPWTYASYPELRTEFDSVLIDKTSYKFSLV
ncbi:uncharacterized protein LOC119008776 isoform X1 [Xyrichtys novacula]|uniref:Uncharacterized protein LOC119008776 isoform X1 n=1 Tax=Xyrichtys novacula TaxID=13765 RepID=A0AAV1GA82_XYRNO|nr:uncharacterized protein LOC119008776 isoform X1 [Xyrichtys novacula]